MIFVRGTEALIHTVWCRTAGELFFAANDGVTGDELWKCGGTAVGAVFVKDIRPGPVGSYPEALSSSGNNFYLAANDGLHGPELWSSDGTEGGTTLIADIAQGRIGSAPIEFTHVGRHLVFSANDVTHGYEPWSLDLTNSLPVSNSDQYSLQPGTTLTTSAIPGQSNGASVYQTNPLPSPPYVSGFLISAEQFLGARFEVTSPVETSSIGGLLHGDGDLFGAIVRLSGPEDMPDSTDLSTSDVIAHAVVPATPVHQVISAPISAELTPGWYAIVFGTGRFGATGNGGADYPPNSTYDAIFTLSNHQWQAEPNVLHFFLKAAAAGSTGE